MKRTTQLSIGALSETARALADRGEHFGWNPYYKGNRIPPAALKKLAKADDAVLAWYEAFRAAVTAYKLAVGSEWRY